jgi:hypothetical protein
MKSCSRFDQAVMLCDVPRSQSTEKADAIVMLVLIVIAISWLAQKAMESEDKN